MDKLKGLFGKDDVDDGSASATSSTLDRVRSEGAALSTDEAAAAAAPAEALEEDAA